MKHLTFKKSGCFRRRLWTMFLCLLLAFSLVLTIGCQNKPGKEQNKAAEKAAEVKDKAVEKASEVKAKVTGWDSCKGCHKDGDKPGPSKATLLKKFKTAADFIKAAKESKNSMMNNFKKDGQLKAAATDLGLK